MIAIVAICTLDDAKSTEPTKNHRVELTLANDPDDTFTIAVIPDTQHYVGPGTKISASGNSHVKNSGANAYTKAHAQWELSQHLPVNEVVNPYLEKHVDWILEHRNDLRIAFVSHVGDIVDKNRPAEWAVAAANLNRLREVVPFGLCVGNHDMETSGDASLFQSTFGADSFKRYPWYVGSYNHDRSDASVSRDNVNSAQKFEAGGIKFLFLHLECNAPNDVLVWANETIRSHPDHRVLITTHMDLGVADKPKSQQGFVDDPKGRMNWSKIHGKRGNTAVEMWTKCYRLHSNVDFVFSGDQSRVTALKLTETANDGHPIYSLLSDYQSLGAIRILKFCPSNSSVEVITYDTALGTLVEATPYVKNRDQHQFTLPWMN